MKKGLRDKVLIRDNHKCVRHKENTCKGRPDTMEHAFARKYERFWNVLTMCAYHAAVDEYSDKKGFNKEINKYYAYKNATDQDILEFKAVCSLQERDYLFRKFG
jgi:hypothetical protein